MEIQMKDQLKYLGMAFYHNRKMKHELLPAAYCTKKAENTVLAFNQIMPNLLGARLNTQNCQKRHRFHSSKYSQVIQIPADLKSFNV